MTAHVIQAHALATQRPVAIPVVELSRQAIRSWRDLARLDNDTASGSALVYGTRPLSGRVA